jgi:hypothetical protein
LYHLPLLGLLWAVLPALQLSELREEAQRLPGEVLVVLVSSTAWWHYCMTMLCLAATSSMITDKDSATSSSTVHTAYKYEKVCFMCVLCA